MTAKNVAASVRARLLNISRETHRPFQELLQYYAMERLLYRLCRSPHDRCFILKGALMLRVWNAPVSRPTKDVDLLGHVDNDVENLASILRDICQTDVEPDGIIFDAAAVLAQRIKEDAEYEGVRLKVEGRLDSARITVQLDEAFRDAWIGNWSAQRLAIAVLDAHGGELSGADAVSTLKRLTPHQSLRENAATYWRRGAPVQAREDGTLVLDATHPHVRAARKAVRDKLEVDRRYADRRFDPTVHDAQQRYIEKKRQAHAEELARLRRVILHGFPPQRPEAVVLLDVADRALDTYVGDEIDAARARLAEYDLITALDVRPVLRGLEFDPGERRVVELGPP